MDCKKVVVEVANYFAEGYRRDRFGFFSRELDKNFYEQIREIINEEREGKDYSACNAPLRPRTSYFIDTVRFIAIADSRDMEGDGRDFKFLVDNGNVEDPYDVIGRSLMEFERLGYGYLLNE